MNRILIYVLLFTVLGSSLALVSIHFSFSTGWAGAICLITWAIFMRKRWAHIEQNIGNEPSLPERVLWVQAAAYSVLLGHLLTALIHTDIDMRVGNGNTLAVDSWLMVFASIAIEFIFRKERRVRDERDAKYVAKSMKLGYFALVTLIAMFALYLGITPPSYRAVMTHFLLGNVLISLILISYLFQLVVRIHIYYQDRLQPEVGGGYQ